MAGENLNDLRCFHRVAKEMNFTRAAAQLGMSRSGLSHAINGLEAKLGVRLLMRTTRSVSLTEAGTRLLATLDPMLTELDSELEAIQSMSTKTAGMVRITAHDQAINAIIWPRLLPLLLQHPDINVELSVDYGLTDIVAQQFDAGVRVGNIVEKDMVAVRISPDFKMSVVASPEYLKNKPLPMKPADLTSYSCINLRLPTHGGLYAWDFSQGNKDISVRVTGQIILNNTYMMLQAALDGMGLSYIPYSMTESHINDGKLVPLLVDYWPVFPGYHLYYANRRHASAALLKIIEALRYTE